MTDMARDEQIELWLEDVSGSEGPMVDSETEACLFRAFRQVLQAMPVDMCRQFLGVPRWSCAPAYRRLSLTAHRRGFESVHSRSSTSRRRSPV
jgi:hypothetical protein